MKIYVLFNNDQPVEAYFSKKEAEKKAKLKEASKSVEFYYWHVHSVEVKDADHRRTD